MKVIPKKKNYSIPLALHVLGENLWILIAHLIQIMCMYVFGLSLKHTPGKNDVPYHHANKMKRDFDWIVSV